MQTIETANDKQKEVISRLPSGVLGAIQKAMNEVEMALVKNDPEIASYLRESHKLLISYPETTHLLNDEEIYNLTKAAEIHTQTKIIEDTVKKAKTGPKTRASSMSADDL